MKIATKIIGITLAAFILSVVTISGVALRAYQVTETEEFLKHINTLSDLAMAAVKSPLWEFDLAAIRKGTDALIDEEPVEAVIYSNNGKVIYGMIKKPRVNIIRDLPIADLNLDMVKHDEIKTHAITEKGRKLGELSIFFSKNSILKKMDIAIKFIFITGFIISGLLFIMFYFYVRKDLLSPIRDLSLLSENLTARFANLKNDLESDLHFCDYLDNYLDNKIETEKHKTRLDEIGGLFKSFYIMNDTICLALKAVSDSSARLNSLNNKLEQVIDVRTKLLKKANDRLKNLVRSLKKTQTTMVQQEKLASIGQIAAGVAHEINNPTGFIMSNLGTLSGYLEDIMMITRSYAKVENAKTLDEKMEIIKEAGLLAKKADLDFIISDSTEIIKDSSEGAVRIKEIVDSLKNYARTDQKEDFSPTNINDCIQTTLKLLGNELKYNAIITKKLDDIPIIMGHGGQLSQVFTNIIVNASHAIKSQEKREMGHIYVHTYSKEEHVWCEIEDNGPGIPEHIKNVIFEPFFTTKEAGKGTGLGLSISYDIIKTKHNGDIWCESTEGKGTKFIIKLPILEIE